MCVFQLNLIYNMPMYTKDFLKSEIEKINSNFANTYLNKIENLSFQDYFFGFSKGKKQGLLISLNVTFPFIKIIDKSINYSMNSFLLKSLKHHLLNSKFLNASLGNDDNILVLEFIKTTDTYDKIRYTLIAELFRANSNLILLSQGKIIDCFRHKSLDTKHPLINGLIYEFPAKSQYFKPFVVEDIEYINDYVSSLERKYLEEKYKPVILSIKRKEKSLEKKVNKLNEEKSKAYDKLKYKDYGDYLLSNLDLISKGDTSILIDGKEIKLNQDLTPTKNLERFYKIYKKAKLTLASCDNFIKETQDEIDYLTSIIEQIDFFNESDFLELLIELKENNLVKVPSLQSAKKIKAAIKPYYIERDGIRIGFGKNNLQNDYLTFTLATKDDYFVHINKDHGPHVIIFDSNPDNEIIQLAGEIAIYLAKKVDGDVVFAKVRTIKKMSAPGKVKLSKYVTYRINRFTNDVKSLIEDAKRF